MKFYSNRLFLDSSSLLYMGAHKYFLFRCGDYDNKIFWEDDEIEIILDAKNLYDNYKTLEKNSKELNHIALRRYNDPESICNMFNRMPDDPVEEWMLDNHERFEFSFHIGLDRISGRLEINLSVYGYNYDPREEYTDTYQQALTMRKISTNL